MLDFSKETSLVDSLRLLLWLPGLREEGERWPRGRGGELAGRGELAGGWELVGGGEEGLLHRLLGEGQV